MTSWRVLEWSRERGRGAITSPHFPRVEFDGASAEVDDFRIGELVHVQVDPSEGALRIARIWPDLPRFRCAAGTSRAEPLHEAARIEAEATLEAVQGWLDLRVLLSNDRVRLELDDACFEYGASAALDLFDPSYVELPLGLSPLYITLADYAARSYLSTRVEIGSSDIAVSVIDDARRFYFVVARRIAAVALRSK